jgi:hypothetical protein
MMESGPANANPNPVMSN